MDSVGGDFKMSAFSTVGDVFTDPEFTALGNALLLGLGALEEENRECTGFLIMPKRPCEWRVDSHGCYKFNNAALALGPRDSSAHFPVFLHLLYLVPTASHSANKLSKDGLSARPTDRSEGRDGVDDRDVVYQSHVSACLSTSSAVISESFVAQLFHTALTLGLLLQVSVSVCSNQA